MSMENFLIFIPTNLFRTYVHMRFLGLFLEHPRRRQNTGSNLEV